MKNLDEVFAKYAKRYRRIQSGELVVSEFEKERVIRALVFIIEELNDIRFLESRGTLEPQKSTTGARPAVFGKFSDLLCAVSTLARSLTNRRSNKG